LTSPLWVALIHHRLSVPTAPHVISHDFTNVQWERVLGFLSSESVPVREGWANIGDWVGNPLAFLARAYGVDATGMGWSPWRVVGWCVAALGVAMVWLERHSTPREALLRFCSLYLVLQVGLLFLVARDMHHLAHASLTLAVVVGLSADHVSRSVLRPVPWNRFGLAGLLVTPWMVSGGTGLVATDAVVERIEVPTFTRAGQEALVDMLRRRQVERLVAADYELYGAIEVLAPEIEVVHGWGAVSHLRGEAAVPLLRRAAQTDAHVLALSASAPMIYNLKPRALQRAASGAGVLLEEVDSLANGSAQLYRVQWAP
jgi:hypothetical protein